MAHLLEVKNLKRYFKTPKGVVHAVDDVSFSIEEGTTLGVVGESGCGKSTLGRTISNLLQLTEGEIWFNGKNISGVKGKEFRELCKEIQMIFQDPFSSLNPRMTVSEIINEPLEVNNIYTEKDNRRKRVSELMEIVGLTDRLYHSYPHELDGGRRQRIGIARALALNPKFIICDEPVSALDVSIQAQILNLMQDLQESYNFTYMFITHDLSVVRHMSDEIIVMYLGKIIEKCLSDQLFNKQLHPYTKALLTAVPVHDLDYKRDRIILKGEIPSPFNSIPGCRFASRCNYVKNECLQEMPLLRKFNPGHYVACHFAEDINKMEVD